MTSCSNQSRVVDEPMLGTAPVAQCWVVIEQPGPWGRQALTDSHLDPEVGAALASASEGTGTMIVLARHPDRLERTTGSPERNVWIAHSTPGRTFMRHGVTDDVGTLTGWDFAAMALGHLPPFGTATRQTMLFVCTHSGRDACCAVQGRTLINELLAAADPGERPRIWESSHLGGHRFAPTALSLPGGRLYGRLTLAHVRAMRDAEATGRLVLDRLRGRSAFPAPMQVAEGSVRVAEGIVERDVLDVLWVRGDRCVPVRPGVPLDNIGSMLTEVRHVDGRAWRVPVRQLPLAEPRAESCGKDPIDGYAWRAQDVIPVAPWQ